MMVLSSPQWFNILSSVYHLVSFLIAGAITLLGYKAYKLFSTKKYLHFAVSFLFITLSFIVVGLTNLIVYLKIDSTASTIFSIINYGFMLYVILTIIGFFLLAILTFKIKDFKIISIFSIGMIAALIFLPFIRMFHVILLVLTLLLSYYFYNNCRQKKKLTAILVFSAFMLMMLSHVFHLASSTSEVIYLVGNSFLVAGYILLLVTLLRFK